MTLVTPFQYIKKSDARRNLRALMLAGACTLHDLIFSMTVAAEDKPFAAPQLAEQLPASSAGSLVQVTVSLALVLVAVFVAAWVLQRLRGFGKFGSGAVEIIAELGLGTKERAVLVQIGNQQLLLGVAPGRVSTLHVLSEPIVRHAHKDSPEGSAGALSSAVPPTDFRAILKRSLGLK